MQNAKKRATSVALFNFKKAQVTQSRKWLKAYKQLKNTACHLPIKSLLLRYFNLF
jgi:hypothetical protein